MRRALALLCLTVGCQPSFDRLRSSIDQPRVLAVRSEPPEARPGTQIALEALLVDVTGPVSGAAASWAFCMKPRPAADSNTFSALCLEAASSSLLPLVTGADPLTASALLPTAGCAVFGSEPAPPKPGEPPLRAADPDPSGGYYQPVRLTVGAGQPVAFAQIRLQCALPQAPAAVAQAFRDGYHPNKNPGLTELAFAGGATTVARGASVLLFATWPADDAEPYLAYDLKSSTLQDRVETLRVAWFATAGTLASDPTLHQGGAEVAWAAPAVPGTAHFWAVLRDDRGGMGWKHLAVEVR